MLRIEFLGGKRKEVVQPVYRPVWIPEFLRMILIFHKKIPLILLQLSIAVVVLGGGYMGKIAGAGNVFSLHHIRVPDRVRQNMEPAQVAAASLWL
jgi:hypothetical protein